MVESMDTSDRLTSDHTPEAIRQRLDLGPRTSYLRDLVYGAIDGTITTFAVVAGVVGASLRPTVIIILGVANLVADGFSMAASNFLATRSEREQRERVKREEERHVASFPEGEREEVRQIYAAKGFTGADLERAVEIITADRKRWIDTMLQEEHGLPSSSLQPFRSGAATFVAFVAVGTVPLLAFLYDWLVGALTRPFMWSSLLTAMAFFSVGALKGRFVDLPAWRAGAETLAVGGIAALAAYGLGAALGGLL
jgi:VIT1/CCC1 family predicted Fe2+/Mn2+ transporter